MVDLTQNPLQNAESLLQQTRQNRRRQERDDTRGMLFNLAGQVIGNVLQGRQVEKYNTFMNKKDVLDRRAIVRSAVNNAQKTVERGRLASSYTGGKKSFFENELFETYKAHLDTRMKAVEPNYNTAQVDQLARNMAAESVDDYIKAFDTQLKAAQDVVSTTGNDELAYAKALREASGVDAGVMGRGLRKLTSFFLDEDDKNLDGALYRSVTSDRIYQTSKEFQDGFDKFYSMTGDSLMGLKLTEALEKTGDIGLAPKAKQIVSLTRRNEFGETETESWLEVMGYDGQPESYISTDGDRISASAWAKRKNDGKRDGTRMSKTGARATFAEATDALDEKGLKALREQVNLKVPTNATSEQRNAVEIVFGEHIALGRENLEVTFGDTATRSQLVGISATAQVLDRKAFDERPTLLAGNNRAHPLVTWQATIEYFNDDYNAIPADMRERLEADVDLFFKQEKLDSMSNQDLRDALRFVDNAGFVFGKVGNVFDDEDIFRLYSPDIGPTMQAKLKAEVARRNRR